MSEAPALKIRKGDLALITTTTAITYVDNRDSKPLVSHRFGRVARTTRDGVVVKVESRDGSFLWEARQRTNRDGTKWWDMGSAKVTVGSATRLDVDAVLAAFGAWDWKPPTDSPDWKELLAPFKLA